MKNSKVPETAVKQAESQESKKAKFLIRIVDYSTKKTFSFAYNGKQSFNEVVEKIAKQLAKNDLVLKHRMTYNKKWKDFFKKNESSEIGEEKRKHFNQSAKL